MTKRPTQVDVARLAGVSRATVSYIVNGVTDDRVSITPETRQRVLDAVRELDYQPDATAQSLRLGKTHTIGLLIPDMRNPHLWQVARGAEQQTQAKGYDLLLASTALDAERESTMMNALSRRRIDGLILMLTHSTLLNREFDRLAKKRMPMVVMGEYVPLLDMVQHGYDQAALTVMRHLIDLGHRRIGLVYGVDSQQHGTERLEAYQQALIASGIPINPHFVIKCGGKIEEGYQAAQQLLLCRPRPTAIIVINDLLAIATLRAIADCGLSVPRDVSIISYDDIDFASYLTPALTTVHGNAEEMGRAAVRLIFERIRDPSRPPQRIAIASQLIVRETTGPPPEDA
jgi:LacI family transcriptional regulator